MRGILSLMVFVGSVQNLGAAESPLQILLSNDSPAVNDPFTITVNRVEDATYEWNVYHDGKLLSQNQDYGIIGHVLTIPAAQVGLYLIQVKQTVKQAVDIAVRKVSIRKDGRVSVVEAAQRVNPEGLRAPEALTDGSRGTPEAILQELALIRLVSSIARDIFVQENASFEYVDVIKPIIDRSIGQLQVTSKLNEVLSVLFETIGLKVHEKIDSRSFNDQLKIAVKAEWDKLLQDLKSRIETKYGEAGIDPSEAQIKEILEELGKGFEQLDPLVASGLGGTGAASATGATTDLDPEVYRALLDSLAGTRNRTVITRPRSRKKCCLGILLGL